ncbi:hypothetical protein [Mucilaginibacter gracilis]|uniref:hypothetical protein n=1 Tax=Mucilaginibacter gracilis TaxID=423350 RepID=UPI000EAF92CA|nr:hypothetical protein [Mucilaginibacter gracilis]
MNKQPKRSDLLQERNLKVINNALQAIEQLMASTARTRRELAERSGVARFTQKMNQRRAMYKTHNKKQRK